MSYADETRITLGQLRTFLAVASTGSVRAAADQLVVTQPGGETLARGANRLVVVSASGSRGSGVPHRAMTAVGNAGSGSRRRGRGRGRAVTALELAEATWLLREPGSGTRATAEALLDG